MNIFLLHSDPFEAPKYMVDTHVVKMITESNQLLSTAHRVLDGELYFGKTASGSKIKRWRLSDEREDVLYKATHVNHPCAIWARESNNNYTWLYCHTLGLCKEYTFRYGKKHKGETIVQYLQQLPANIPVGPLTRFPEAMPEEYKISKNTVDNYRNFYANGKSHLHKWKNRDKPEWLDKYIVRK
jgi:hypothetical protein